MRILLIAYYYPPVEGGGSVRPAQMARHLRRLGHQVWVLTHTYGATDLSGSELRVRDPSCNRSRAGLGRLSWAGRRAIVEGLNRAGIPKSIYWWWQRNVEGVLPVVAERVRPEVVIATYSPVECLELGVQVSREVGIPLVADFRDGLLFEPIEARRISAYPCVRRHYERVEAETVRSAAAITAALPALVEDFTERYGVEIAHALPNAFDTEDFEDIVAVDLPAEELHLVHTGGFAASDVGCDIAPFAAAVHALVKARPEAVERLRIHQLGRLTRAERALLAPLRNLGVLVDHGVVDRATCLGFQKRADVALLITSTHRAGVTPGKIFEYLGSGCAVLALAEGTFAAEIVRDTGCGWVVHPEDQEGIVERLAAILSAGPAVSVVPDPARIARYSVQRQAEVLDRLLRGLV